MWNVLAPVQITSKKKIELTSSRKTIGTISKDVFKRHTSNGSEAFSLFICLDANKLVLLIFFSLFKTIYPRVSTKPLPNDAKSPLPVDVHRSKTLLLKLPNVWRRKSLNSLLSLELQTGLLIGCRKKGRFRGILRDKFVEISADFAGIFQGKLHHRASGKETADFVVTFGANFSSNRSVLRWSDQRF